MSQTMPQHLVNRMELQAKTIRNPELRQEFRLHVFAQWLDRRDDDDCIRFAFRETSRNRRWQWPGQYADDTVCEGRERSAGPDDCTDIRDYMACKLTDRQSEIAWLLERGYTPKEIAERQGLSADTVYRERAAIQSELAGYLN